MREQVLPLYQEVQVRHAFTESFQDNFYYMISEIKFKTEMEYKQIS